MKLDLRLKRCRTCEDQKSVLDFNRFSRNSDGLSSECRDCAKERGRTWQRDNPARNAAKKRRYWAKHRERECAKRRAYYAANTLRMRAYDKKSLYGLSAEEYRALIERNDGRCEVCGRDDIQMNVDHDHKTGRVRGFLCNNCNGALGLAGDSVKRLEQLAAYLMTHEG